MPNPKKTTTASKKRSTAKSDLKPAQAEPGSRRRTAEESLVPGPRKKRKGPAIRLSNHKARSVWFQTRATWPVREAPVRTLVSERNRATKALAQPANIHANWECVGPTNIGGRLTCIACHPTHPERIWVGGPAAAYGRAMTPARHGNHFGMTRTF